MVDREPAIERLYRRDPVVATQHQTVLLNVKHGFDKTVCSDRLEGVPGDGQGASGSKVPGVYDVKLCIIGRRQTAKIKRVGCSCGIRCGDCVLSIDSIRRTVGVGGAHRKRDNRQLLPRA